MSICHFTFAFILFPFHCSPNVRVVKQIGDFIHVISWVVDGGDNILLSSKCPISGEILC